MRRARYRLRQFWRYLRPAPLGPDERAEVLGVLPPKLAALFWQMPPGEQAHGLRVLRAVRAARPEAPAELLQAALLHDAGKLRAPLSLAGRAVVVLAGRLLPAQAARWGRGEPRGWRRPFVTAAQHAEWGAALAAAAGAPPLTVALVRRHPWPPPPGARTPEDDCLAALRLADDDS
jgi:hypothetical protein